MADKTLVTYIRNGLQQGNSLEALQQALVQQGWDQQAIQEAITKAQGTPAPVQPSGSRPTGVTIISIIGIILSVLGLIGGILVIVGGVMVGGAGGIEGLFGGFFLIAGLIGTLLGIVGLLAFILLVKMRKSGLWLVVVIGVISIIQGLYNYIYQAASLIGGSPPIGPLISVIVWIVIIFYLLKKRSHF